MSVINNSFNLLGIDVYFQYIFKGLIILAAVGFDSYSKRFAIAYLLNFILKFYEDRIFIKSEKLKKLKQSSKRGLGLLLT
ncbi:hypothetical protein ACTPD5_22080, partial [Clostridioides difficile]